MNLLIFLGLLILALALVFAVFFKKSVIDRQIEKLNDLEDEVEKCDYLKINGKDRINNIVSIQVKEQNIQFLIPLLDMKGIFVSGGSSCMSGSVLASPTLINMGLSEEQALSSIRVSFSIYNTIDEVKYAVNVLQQSKDTSFTVLHCNTQYPTDPEDMNLRAMNKLQELAPDWKIGLSDHSEGIVASLVAVGLGAKFIEKHFTLDKAMPGPDHKASITPEELKELCVGVHKAEIMLGNETKEVTESERSNIFVARKSIVAKRKIMRGEMFSEENITCKRPGNGISPIHWYDQ